MDNTTKLRVMFDMVDNMTKPLQMMLTGNKGLADSLRATRRELDDMAKTQKRIGEFREMRKGLANTASVSAARARVDTLAQSLRATRSPSQQMISDFNKAQRAAENLASAHHYHRPRTSHAHPARRRGHRHAQPVADERNLRATMASRASMIDAGCAGTTPGASSKPTPGAPAIDALRGVGEKWAKRGETVKGAGKNMLGMLSDPLDAAKQAESETLRMRAAGASADAVKFARAAGPRAVDHRQPGADARIADRVRRRRTACAGRAAVAVLDEIRERGAVRQGRREKNVDQFMSMLKVIDLRGGTKSEAAFGAEANIVQKMQTATGGKVSGDEWNNFAESGGNAAKKLRTDAFYYQMQPLIESSAASRPAQVWPPCPAARSRARRPHSPRNGWRRSASSIRSHAPEERCDRRAQAGRAGTQRHAAGVAVRMARKGAAAEARRQRHHES